MIVKPTILQLRIKPKQFSNQFMYNIKIFKPFPVAQNHLLQTFPMMILTNKVHVPFFIKGRLDLLLIRKLLICL
jgi:hypothetical protein